MRSLNLINIKIQECSSVYWFCAQYHAKQSTEQFWLSSLSVSRQKAQMLSTGRNGESTPDTKLQNSYWGNKLTETAHTGESHLNRVGDIWSGLVESLLCEIQFHCHKRNVPRLVCILKMSQHALIPHYCSTDNQQSHSNQWNLTSMLSYYRASK